MKTTININSQSVKDSIRSFSFRKPKTEYFSKSSDQNDSSNNKKSGSPGVCLQPDGGCGNFTPNRSNTFTVNKKTPICDNFNFYTLPSNGQRIKNPITKTLITSDTFSQTKTLLYADHQKSPAHCLRYLTKDKDLKQVDSISNDSLNSSDDPQIVAALDQIASTMGLINIKVPPTSNDPVNYLMKTRSFSEKLSLHKNSPIINRNDIRVQSFMERTKSPLTNLDQFNISQQAMTTKIKENSFKKMINKLSPKLLRRTKSSSPSASHYSTPESSRASKISNDSMVMIDHNNSNKRNVLSKKIYSQKTNMKIGDKTNTNCNDFKTNSKYFLNSLQSDQTEDSQSSYCINSNDCIIDDKIRQISSEEFFTIPITLEITPNLEKYDQLKPCSETYSPILRHLPPSSSRYINISLSAFGYGTTPSLSRSAPFRRTICQTKANYHSNISDISGAQIYSDDDKINQR